MNKINLLLKDYPQFKKQSLLFDNISEALGCGIPKASELARTHCNLVSFWAILFSSGNYKSSYAKFFKWMLEENYCDTHGYILTDKKNVLDKLLIDSTLETYRDFEDIVNPFRLNPEKYYQIKIKGDTEGFHFMACYLEDGILYGPDTSYRGNPFKLLDKVTQKNFVKITEVC